MADPVKIKIECENPNNIEAEVPGAQKIRGSVDSENGECEVSTLTSEMADTFHAEPVITVTKNEATFTKGDLKLQKVTVTEDVSVNLQHLFKTQTTPGKTVMPHNTIPIDKEYTEEVLEDGQPIRKHHTTSNTNGEDKNDDRKTKTKIPVSRFRQTVEKVKVERRASKEKEHESQIPIRRSSIPKLAINKTAPIKPVRKTITVTQKTQKVTQTTAPEDEFDKLYEEVVCSTPTPVNIDVSLLDPKVDDPENVENTFEEIIHDYDENKVEPIDVEKIRKSKIPFLKRKSQHEIEVNGDRSSKIIAARDKLKIRHSSTKSDEKKDETIKAIEDVNDKRDDNHPTPKTELKSQYTKTITTSSKGNEEDDSTKVISTTMITEVETIESSDKIEHKKGQLIEENIYKEYIKVGIPVFDSYIHEYTEKSKIEETVEVKRVLSYTSNNGNFDVDKTKSELESNEINNENKLTIVEIENNTEPKIVDIIDISENSFESLKPELSTEKQRELDDTKMVLKEKDDIIEDLRGKVGRLISKIDSHDPVDKEALKINFGNGLPKKKSVMSRIAMFEQHQAEPVANSKIPSKDTKFSKLLSSDTQRTKLVHIHTPLIVDEVFKPFQSITETDNSDVISTNGVERNATQIVTAEMVIIESPETVRYDVDNKVQIKSNTLFIEESLDSATLFAEEVLTPVLRKFEFENNDDTNENDVKDVFVDTKLDVAVLVPEFIPVKEVLKKYESFNDHESNKALEDLPKIRPISEIISNSTPEVNYRSLDAMFAHQVRPVSEILNDLNPQEHKDEIVNNIYVTEQSGIKSELKVDDSTNLKEIEAKNDTSSKVDTTQHEFKSFKTRDIAFKTLESRNDNFKSLQFIQNYVKSKDDDLKRAKSVAELDLGDAVKGKVNRMIVRINSVDKIESVTKEVPINIKELPRKRSVSEKIALFEMKLTPTKEVRPSRINKLETLQKRSEELPVTHEGKKPEILTAQSEELTAQTDLPADIQEKINQLTNAKLKYGKMKMPRIELANGMMMPVLAIGTALLDPQLAYHIVAAAIDLGYRAIDTAYIYGNEKVIGEAIRAKINDGTVKREELFIISKLWSTFHKTDLVKVACEASLEAMGLEYFDLFLIHNPMSFKEGGSPMPQIASVLQYSEFDYMDAWFGMETLGSKVKALGVSNFNSTQLQRVIDRSKVKPVINQVECHPYLSQQKLDKFCSERNISLSCFGVLGSKGTPSDYKSGQPAVIDDALVKVMASGLNVSPAQLLIRYQIECGHNVVVKSSSAARLWDNLQALTFNLTSAQVDALHALNRNKRNFTFKGMGDTHKNYPFNTAF